MSIEREERYIRIGFRDNRRAEDENNQIPQHLQIARTVIIENRIVQCFVSWQPTFAFRISN